MRQEGHVTVRCHADVIAVIVAIAQKEERSVLVHHFRGKVSTASLNSWRPSVQTHELWEMFYIQARQ